MASHLQLPVKPQLPVLLGGHAIPDERAGYADARPGLSGLRYHLLTAPAIPGCRQQCSPPAGLFPGGRGNGRSSRAEADSPDRSGSFRTARRRCRRRNHHGHDNMAVPTGGLHDTGHLHRLRDASTAGDHTSVGGTSEPQQRLRPQLRWYERRLSGCPCCGRGTL